MATSCSSVASDHRLQFIYISTPGKTYIYIYIYIYKENTATVASCCHLNLAASEGRVKFKEVSVIIQVTPGTKV